jgi:topoisomerase-4 subunit A
MTQSQHGTLDLFTDWIASDDAPSGAGENATGIADSPNMLMLPPEPPSNHFLTAPDSDDGIDLPTYAERCYLEYAMSVVKGRALPDVQDGQKPVQRRILYTMKQLGLDASSKPVKSARVVGEVLGKYHPHGDSAAYDAMVRMAQDFSLRYPLIDGQGNFGSRDGDGAAAMRYTEARLTPISELLLDHLDSETVDWTLNYDGSLPEPLCLPARLPFALLNGASGIAVGMACELPSHNLREVAAACERVILGVSDLDTILSVLPAPDFSGGGQIINPDVLPIIYSTGRGSIRVRARWRIEPLAKGQWRVVVDELPPGTSTARVMAEIETLLNPQPKAGKKSISPEQTGLKAALANLLEVMRDESDGQHPVRLVLEPRSRLVTQEELMTFLLAHTSLEQNVSVNLTVIGRDGNPRQKGLLAILQEWASFRIDFFRRRCLFEHRKASERAHILQGRLLVLLHIDEVIAVIRHSDEPKAELMARFGLSDTQAEDILEIRLRQLAHLEHIKLQQELDKLMEQLAELARLLADDQLLKQAIVDEIRSDAKRFGDDRRTLIEAASVITASDAIHVADEPVTVIVSKQGFVRSRTGKLDDVAALAFKTGDGLLSYHECRTVDWLFVLDTTGRAYSIPVAQLPGGKGDGVPISALVDLPSGEKAIAFACGKGDQWFVVAGTHAKGFICQGQDMVSNRKAGKVFFTIDPGHKPMLLSVPLNATLASAYLVLLSSAHYGLCFPLTQLRQLSGGAGVNLIADGCAQAMVVTNVEEKVLLGKWKVIPSQLLGKRAARGIMLQRTRK